MADLSEHRGRTARLGLSRREFLQQAGRGGMGLVVWGLLAACTITEPAARPTGPSELPPLAHELDVAQWPLYIDRGRGGHRPTLEQFEEETGIDVAYREVISDNAEFLAVLAPSLSSGEQIRWDIVALSDWVVTKLVRAGWVEPLDHDLLPNVDANMAKPFRDAAYDPGHAHSVPWQGGVTGIGYNPELTGRTLTSFEDLWDPAFAGHVGMLTEMVDTMGLTLLKLGIDPERATVDDAERAQRKLLEQRDEGIVRGYYGNDYIDGLARGDLWATMAWSGDIFFLRLDNPELEFVVPEEGGIRWVTPLEIPLGAAHPRDAHAFMDFFYRPEIAAQVTEWVGYISPVAGVKDLILEHASESSGGTRDYLEELGTSPLVFPTPEMEGNLHVYKVFSEEEEQAWNDLFGAVVLG